MAWSLWHQALGHFENNNQLLIPLRQWTDITHQRWRWYAELGTNTVFQEVVPRDWRKFRLSQQQSLRQHTRQATHPQYDIRSSTQITRTPQPIVPVTLMETAVRHMYTFSPGPPLCTHKDTTTIYSFESKLYIKSVGQMLDSMPEQSTLS